MLLDGKRVLVTGVISERSIAFAVARQAQQQGAEVVLTGFGRGLRLTGHLAQRLAAPVDVLELDVTCTEQVEAVAAELDRRWGGVDGILHAVAYAPPSALDGGFLTTPWPDVARSLQVSTYSFAEFGRSFGPLLAASGGGSLVGVDFDAAQAWPGYDWMGVAKAGLESCCRYLAGALGPQGTRVNLVAAGPLRTVAAGAIGAFGQYEQAWAERAPLGWDVHDASAVARVVCALWSDWLPAVTGEIIHVDGGVHAMAAGGAGGTVRPPAAGQPVAVRLPGGVPA